MSCELTETIRDITRLKKAEGNSANKANTLKSLENLRDTLLAAKYAETTKNATIDIKLPVKEAVDKMLEEDVIYNELVQNYKDSKVAVTEAFSKFNSNKTMSKDSTVKGSSKKAGDKKDGTNTLNKSEKALVTLNEYITTVQEKLEYTATAADKASSKAARDYWSDSNDIIAAEMSELQNTVKSLKALIKYSKSNITRGNTLFEAAQKAIEVSIAAKEAITEYRNVFTTGGNILLWVKNNSRKTKHATDVDAITIADYFTAKSTSIDLLNVGKRIKTALSITTGDRSTKNHNIAKARDMIKVVLAGVLKFTKSIDVGTSKLHIGDYISTDAKVKGFQNVGRLLYTLVPYNPETKLPDHNVVNQEVAKAIAICSLDWAANIGGRNRAFNRSDDDAKRMLNKNTNDVLSAEERDIINRFDGLQDSSAIILGKMIFDMLGLKTKPSTDGINNERIEAKLQLELGLIALKSLEYSGILKLHTSKDRLPKQDMDDVVIEALANKEFVEGYATPYESLYGESTTGKNNLVSTFSFTAPNGASLYERFDKDATNGNQIVTGGTETAIVDLYDVLGYTPQLTGPYFTEGTNKTNRDDIVNQGISRKVGETPEVQKDAIENSEDTPRTFDENFLELIDVIIDEISIDGLYRELGWKDVDTAYIDDRTAVRGKNLAIERSMKYLQETRKTLNELGKSKMWFKWYVVTNGRFGIKSNTFNVQDQKLHRNSVNTEMIAVTKGSVEEDLLILAMAQGFHISVDKQTFVQSKKEFVKLSKEIDKILGASVEDFTSEAVTKAFRFVNSKTSEPEHALRALSEYIQYRAWNENGATEPLITGITLETDAVTSGYILKLLQMPIFKTDGILNMEKVIAHLAKGGVFKHEVDADGNTINQSYEEWKMEPTNKDSYETVASAFGKQLHEATQSENLSYRIGKPNVKFTSLSTKEKDNLNKIAIEEQIKVVAIMAVLGETKVKDSIIQISRSFMKNPFMVFNYGSAINSIVKSLSNTAVENLNGLMTKAANRDYPSKASDGGEVTTTEAKNKAIAEADAAMTILVDAILASAFGRNNDTRAASTERTIQFVKQLDAAYKEDPMSLLEFKIPKDIRKLVFEATQRTIKEPLTATFKSEYGEFLEAGKTINSAMVMLMRAATPKIEAAIDAQINNIHTQAIKDGTVSPKSKPRPLTNREIDEIILDLRDTLPVLNMPLGDGDKSKILLAAEDAGEYNINTVLNVDTTSGFTFEDTPALRGTSRLYKLVEKYTSGAVIPIHFMDGSIQSRVLSVFKALGVHDANLFTLKDAVPGTKAYNKAVIELAKSYSLTTEVLNSVTTSLNTLSTPELEALDDNYLNEFVKKKITSIVHAVAKTNAVNSTKLRTILVDSIPKIIMTIKNQAPLMPIVTANEELYREAVADVLLQVVYELQSAPTVNDMFIAVVELQKSSEEGRDALFNGDALYVEHAALEGAAYVAEKTTYTKQIPIDKSPTLASYLGTFKGIVSEWYLAHSADELGRTISTVVTPLKPAVKTNTTQGSINIYSTDKNGYEGLSNLVAGPVERLGIVYKTVEAAFQATKAKYLGDVAAAARIIDASTGAQAKQLGDPSGIIKVGSNTKTLKDWDNVATKTMKLILSHYYNNDNKAAELLLSTGNSTLTHTQDKGKWATIFPQLLMEIRSELQNDTTKNKPVVDYVAKVREVNKGTTADKHTEKEVAKASMANKYIGFGSANSSTHRYAGVYGNNANRTDYVANDIVWVSSNGRRTGRVNPVQSGKLVNGYQILDNAIEAGATIVMDTEAHLANSSTYNIGETALADYMVTKGYSRVTENKAGVWRPNKDAELLLSTGNATITHTNETPIPTSKYSVPENITELKPNEVFVFGSNQQGRHGKGAALTAKQKFGAEQGKGEGEFGNTYALPTKSTPDVTLTIEEVTTGVNKFLAHAAKNLDKMYLVTAIGTGLAGMMAEDIAPLFKEAGDNVKLPKAWENISMATPTAGTPNDIAPIPFKLKIAGDEINLMSVIGFQDGRLAQADANDIIYIKKGLTVEEVLEYLTGGDSKTAIQKKVITEYMKVQGIDLIATIERMTDAQVKKFIAAHEYVHILQKRANGGNLKDAYYADNKQTLAGDMADTANRFLSDSAIKFEADANTRGLELIGIVPIRIEDDISPLDVDKMAVTDIITNELQGSTLYADVVKILESVVVNKIKYGLRTMHSDSKYGNPFVTEKAYEINSKGYTYIGGNEQVSVAYYNWLKDNTLPAQAEKYRPLLDKARVEILNNLEAVRSAAKEGGIGFHYTGTAKTGVSHVSALIAIANDGKVDTDGNGVLVQVQKDSNPTIVPGETTTPAKSTKKSGDTKYELFPGVYANEGQVAAIDVLTDFLKGNETEYVLKGRGGTGKTTIVNKVLENVGLLYSEVYFTTITHKAKQVIEAANKNSRYAKSPYAVTQSSLFKFGKPLKNKIQIESPKVIVVDEASMVNEKIIQDILDTAKDINAKVLFMGDNVQLQPVTGSIPGASSPIFDSELHPNVVELEERMRQGEESPILPITDMLANFVEGNGDVSFDGVSHVTPKGTVEYMESGDVTTSEFVKDFKKAPRETRYIWYNNDLHKNTTKLVEQIRVGLYGKRAEMKYVKGEQIILGGNYGNKGKGEFTAFNSEEFTVSNVTTAHSATVKYTEYINGKSFNNQYTYNKPVYHVEATSNSSGKTIVLVSPQESFATATQGLSNTIKEEFAQIAYAYVISSHKAQGSTYKTVYTDVANILRAPGQNSIDQVKSLYVATSRPTDKLVLVNAGEFITKEYVSAIDTVQDSAIITPIKNKTVLDGYSKQASEAVNKILDSTCKGN